MDVRKYPPSYTNNEEEKTQLLSCVISVLFLYRLKNIRKHQVGRQICIAFKLYVGSYLCLSCGGFLIIFQRRRFKFKLQFFTVWSDKMKTSSKKKYIFKGKIAHWYGSIYTVTVIDAVIYFNFKNLTLWNRTYEMENASSSSFTVPNQIFFGNFLFAEYVIQKANVFL